MKCGKKYYFLSKTHSQVLLFRPNVCCRALYICAQGLRTHVSNSYKYQTLRLLKYFTVKCLTKRNVQTVRGQRGQWGERSGGWDQSESSQWAGVISVRVKTIAKYTQSIYFCTSFLWRRLLTPLLAIHVSWQLENRLCRSTQCWGVLFIRKYILDLSVKDDDLDYDIFDRS